MRVYIAFLYLTTIIKRIKNLNVRQGVTKQGIKLIEKLNHCSVSKISFINLLHLIYGLLTICALQWSRDKQNITEFTLQQGTQFMAQTHVLFFNYTYQKCF